MSRSVAKRAVARLQLGFLAALLALIAGVLIDGLFALYALQRLEADAALVNLSGRQRMLGQRAAEEALLFRAGAIDTPSALDTLNELEMGHRALLRVDSLPAEVRARLDAHGPAVEDLRAAVERAVRSEDALPELMRAADASLRSAEALTGAIQEHAEAKQARLLVVHLVGFGALLGLIAGVSTVLLLPLTKEVKGRLREVELATEQARGATEAHTRFLASVSHDLRTPLNGIIGMSGFLARSELSGRQRHWVEAIVSSARNLQALVQDVLDFSRTQAPQMSLESIEMDLVAAVEDTLAEQAPIAAERGLDLFLGIDPALDGTVYGDPLRLRQCLANLVSNALKFTSAGWVRVDVTRTQGDEVRFEVTDTGPGVNPARAGRIFEAFQQGDSSTSREHGGTGLGLAITRRLAVLMGGCADHAPRPEGGSVFWFTAQLPPAQPVTRSFEGAAILLGLPRFRRTKVARWLRAWGVETLEAERLEGIEVAVETVRQRGVDVRLLLADGSGWSVDALLRIRDQLQLSDARLAVLVAPGREQATIDLEGADVQQLSWPLRRDALFELLGSDGKLRVPERPIRVLLVDDNEINREVGTALLSSLGCEVEVAEGGEAAIRAFDEHRAGFDLVLMDRHMPNMDGLATTRALRARGAAVPIIALTASTLEDVRRPCLEAGMNAVLGKPIDEPRLLEVLRSVAPEPRPTTSASDCAPADRRSNGDGEEHPGR